LVYLTFLSKPNGFKQILCLSTDSGLVIQIVLICLLIPSVFIGFTLKDLIVGIGSTCFFNSIFNNVSFFIFNSELLSVFTKILPVILSGFGFFSAFILYNYWSFLLLKVKLTKIGLLIYNFLNRKWYFDKIYNNVFGQFFFKQGYSLSYKFLDKGIFELIGPSGFSLIIYNFSFNLHKIQTEILYHITVSILISLTCFSLIKLYFFNFLFINFLLILFQLFFIFKKY
jgi:hypothetical protein